MRLFHTEANTGQTVRFLQAVDIVGQKIVSDNLIDIVLQFLALSLKRVGDCIVNPGITCVERGDRTCLDHDCAAADRSRRGWGRTRRILRQSQWFLVHGLFGGKFVSYFRILFRGNLIFQRTDWLVWGGMVAGAF